MTIRLKSMRTEDPKTIYLKDYRPYPFEIKHLDLTFQIFEGYSDVTAVTRFMRKAEENGISLFLHGEDLELLSLTIDGEKFEDYTVDDKGMTLNNVPEAFTLAIKTRIKPEDNTRLEGLYKSDDTYCTQCEAEGFRRITYYPDRPDVLTTFTTRVEASKDFPVLLSNGNRIDGGEIDEGRHFTVWEDPWPKPCYLFALVVGDLTHIHDTYTTGSGREVDLYIYVRPGDESQCDHAMDSLKRSMKWDEDVYGLEYDLDLFNIVAVSDFNMGAMENKSLNIFNTALVLAAQETATDLDFHRVESVIAHEYFHNWSGNRVTCRDWFQLSLKEGLTVFRDQEFSADHHSRAVQRIDDVTHLRRLQFPEDAGPLAHPIRPDNYIEINNFYTMTVYEKGAEVIRMTRTLLGEENYRKATDLYFSRHDGQAVTCDGWLACMEEASGVDMSQFKLWYSQAGTPEVHFKGTWNKEAQSYTIELYQQTPDTPGQTNKKPMHIPVTLGLLYPSRHPERSEGSQSPYTGADPSSQAPQDGNDVILHLTEAKQSFRIENVPEEPIPSILRHFSAPIRLKADFSDEDLAFLMVHDNDGFNRWEAGQNFALRILDNVISSEGEKSGSKSQDSSADAFGMTAFLECFGDLIERTSAQDADKALMARMLSIPDITRIAQEQDIVDPDIIHKARNALLAAIKRNHKPALEKLYKANRTAADFSIAPEAVGQRALQNACLSLLTATNGTGCAKLAKAQYDEANNMTDRVAALGRLSDNKNEQRPHAFEDFRARFHDYPLVMDKWFSMQAISTRPGALEDIKALAAHDDFNIKNPNRVRSLYAAFAMNNPLLFHAADGSGYDFLTDAIIQLNTINPQIAARLLTPMREWRRYTQGRQEKMQECLKKILDTPNLAPDVFEIATKSLNA